MDYKEILRAIVFSDNEDDLHNLLQSKPIEEHPEILEQFHALLQDMMLEQECYEIADTLQQLDERIQKYADAVLTELAAKAEYDAALEVQDEAWQATLKRMEGVREYVIECIVTNADNATEMKGFVEHVVDFERKADVYDPKNWDAIFRI